MSSRRLSEKTDIPATSVRAANLVYVNSQHPGISREKRGKHFVYTYQGRPVKDDATLARIASLVIPPAWSDVWICRRENGHLQATGIDSKSRKQYRYHPRWVALRGKTKFDRLGAFGKALPGMRRRLKADLALPGLPLHKVLALLISLMEQTHIRIGNDFYQRLYGSYGLATMQCRHVKVNRTGIRFVFKGKKGVSHDITVHNRKLARIVARCREIPGRQLFKYYDADNQYQTLHSEDVNDYIREICGAEFTSKDFRTWAGSVEFIREFIERQTSGEAGAGDALTSLTDCVAQSLGNTRSVCRKYYIHPAVIASFERGTLAALLQETPGESTWLRQEERILLKLLSKKRH